MNIQLVEYWGRLWFTELEGGVPKTVTHSKSYSTPTMQTRCVLECSQFIRCSPPVRSSMGESIAFGPISRWWDRMYKSEEDKCRTSSAMMLSNSYKAALG
jgi:hypothetical protein